uniref:Uncharacterized protein n=1 Tax=Anguilla anguilla TaxID=7936 RepID=A0A0E9U1S9_ANGAN
MIFGAIVNLVCSAQASRRTARNSNTSHRSGEKHPFS